MKLFRNRKELIGGVLMLFGGLGIIDVATQSLIGTGDFGVISIVLLLLVSQLSWMGFPYDILLSITGVFLTLLGMSLIWFLLGFVIYLRGKKEVRNTEETSKSQAGFALLPVMIAVATLVLIGGGGAVVYQLQRHNKIQDDQLQDQVIDFVQVSSSPSPEATATPEPTPTNEPDSSPTTKPKTSAVQGATTTQTTPVKVAATSTPTPTKQPTPSPAKQSPTPTPTPTQKVATSTPLPVATVDPQEQLRQQQIAQKRAELTAELNDIKRQLTALKQRISELNSAIEEAENTPGLSLPAIQRNTAPLIAEQNALIYQHDELVEEHNALVEQINLLNLL